MLSPDREILIAPFSNSAIRDWPVAHFTRLVGLLLERVEGDAHLTIIGTAGQRLGASEIVRPYETARVTNACGRIEWLELVDRLKRAACVIGNNSGLSHLAGALGVPTVCVFGGSHQRREWRALGASVVIVSRVIGCSPCQLDHKAFSPYDKACLRQISPEAVADAAMRVMNSQATAAGREGMRIGDGRLVSQ